MARIYSCCKDFMQMRFDTLQVEHVTGSAALLAPRDLAVARTFMCILCVIIIGFDANGSISAGQSFGRWLSFLTSWTWVLCLFVLFPGLVISLYFLRPSPSSAGTTATVAAAQPPTSNAAASRQRSALWMRIHWVMWEMAATLSLTITILYWALVYKSGNAVQFSSVGVHGLNAACLLSDTLLSGLPVVGSHVIFPLLFGLCYVIFSVIYVRGTGAVPNYSILTWTSSASIVYSILGLFLILICFGLVFALQRARDFLKLKLRRGRANIESETELDSVVSRDSPVVAQSKAYAQT